MEPTAETSASRRRPAGAPWLVPAAAVARVVAAAAVIFLLVRGSDDSTPAPATTATAAGTAPFAVSAQGLATLAKAINGPIYWAGPRDGKLYELTQAAN